MRVLSGILTNEVVIQLNTNQDTAIGIVIQHVSVYVDVARQQACIRVVCK